MSNSTRSRLPIFFAYLYAFHFFGPSGVNSVSFTPGSSIVSNRFSKL